MCGINKEKRMIRKDFTVLSFELNLKDEQELPKWPRGKQSYRDTYGDGAL